MQLRVLIEPVENNGYRASSGAPLTLTAEGATRDEAIGKLKALIRGRLEKGAEVATLDIAVPATENPWVEFAGMFKDDPLFDDWVKAIAEYRQRVDSDPDIL